MASKRALRRKACTGKVGYDTEAEAREVSSRFHNLNGIPQPYRCSVCGLFHNGHPPKSTQVLKGFALAETLGGKRGTLYGRT